MDQNQTKQHYIQTLDHRVTQFHFSRKRIQILLSISLFMISLLFSCFPLLIWFGHCIGKMSVQLSSYTSDRHCVFLFCNGILVFLIRNSILPGRSPLATDSSSQQSVPDLAEKQELSGEELAEVEQNHDTQLQTLEEEDDDDEEEIDFIAAAAEEEEEEEEIVFIAEEEEEEEIGLLSADELNKRCDDFIRKVKEGMKFEAQNPSMV